MYFPILLPFFEGKKWIPPVKKKTPQTANENHTVLLKWRIREFWRSGSIELIRRNLEASQLLSSRLIFFFSKALSSSSHNLIRWQFSGFLHDQKALAVGNLNFPLSIVQQMIRFSSFPLPMVSVKNFLLIFEILFC